MLDAILCQWLLRLTWLISACTSMVAGTVDPNPIKVNHCLLVDLSEPKLMGMSSSYSA